MPIIVMVMDSINSTLVSRRGVVPMAIKTPNSLVRSNMAIKNVFSMLKATTRINKK